MSAIQPDQIVTLILFLAALGLAWVAVMRHRAALGARLGRGRRLRLAEVAGLGPGDRAMILAVDGQEFLVLRVRGAAPVLVPIAPPAGEGGQAG